MRYPLRAIALVAAAIMLLLAVPCSAAKWTKAPPNPDFVKYREKLAKHKKDKSRDLPESFRSATNDQIGISAATGLIPTTVDFSGMGQQMTMSALSATESSVLPMSYDLRSMGRLTAVRDQSACGSCWTFATVGSLESCLKPWETCDFSENNLKNTHGFSIGCCDGGNHLMSTAYLARWSGAVDESADPYNPFSCSSPVGISPVKHVQNVVYLPHRAGSLDNDQIKRAVMKYGAVYTTIYWASQYENGCSYFCPYASCNHAICIVGWDDAYSRSYFAPACQPPGDGAFIIRNSWGTNNGQSGYYYVSYYDPSIGYDNAAFLSEPTNDYGGIYQYDPYGWTDSIGCGSDTAWFANVFTSTENKRLAAASFYAYQPGSSYEIRVYLDPTSGPLNPSGYAICQTGTLSEAGYHTVAFDNSVMLQSGHRFSVVVRLTTPGYTYPIAIECPGYNYAPASASSGTSYTSANGSSWTDLVSQYPGSNVCLKAFTSYCDGLTVSPVDSGNFAGCANGPFTPDHVEYAITNKGSTAITCLIQLNQTWLSCGEQYQTLQPGSHNTVSVWINQSATAGMAPGTYYGQVQFSNLTNGCGNTTRNVTLTIARGELAVGPASSFATSGPVGGPFYTTSQIYTVKNPGCETVNWTASKSQNWSDISPSSGTLAPGASQDVIVSLNGTANTLTAGFYYDNITFRNTTNGLGNTTRSINLRVGPICVKPNGLESSDGSSWSKALKSVVLATQMALPGTEIWVAAGTYTGNMTLKDGVALYGGFNGTETSRSQRNWSTNNSILDGNHAGSVVTIPAYASSSTRIDGVTIRNGSGTSVNLQVSGGGICCMVKSSPVIANNRIMQNSADCGGAIYSEIGSPRIEGNTITANCGLISLGGVYLLRSDSAVLVNNTIACNDGGVYCDSYGSVQLANNIIAFNNGGVRSEAGCTVTMSHNDVSTNDLYDYLGLQDQTGVNGNLMVYPCLAASTYGNLHLQPNSSCRDAGDNSVVQSGALDMDCQPRIQPTGGAVDIGADESDLRLWKIQTKTIRVAPTGSDANDGSSWALAKKTIQAGIDAIAAYGYGEVWVQAGTYNEHLVLPNYVYLFGGFRGDESIRYYRPAFPRQSPDPYETIVNAGQQGSAVYATNGYRTSTIDGFTLRNGSGASLYGSLCGGGIFCYASSPIIINDRIAENICRDGAGIYCYLSSAKITNSVIVRNSGETGSGVYCYHASPLIADNTISENGGRDASIYAMWDSSPTITNNTVVNNSGGIYVSSGDIAQSVIANNIVALNASGIEAWSGAPTQRNCVYGNSLFDYRGGINHTNDITVDPKLASAGFGNLHIQPDSPCRDTGSNSVVRSDWVDMDGQSRIQPTAGTTDIGADESDGTTWTTTPQIIRVSTTGNDANDGSTWTLAKRTIQAAINSAGGMGEVWVKAGTYNECITLRPYVYLYGGFGGDEAGRTNRPAFPRQSPDALETIIDGGQLGSVVSAVNLGGGTTTVVDGFTIRNGNGTLSGSSRYGGGIYCYNSSPGIVNDTITANSATYGGGVFCDYYANPAISKSAIIGNSAAGASDSTGGGVYCRQSCPSITNTLIMNNSGSGSGGGISASGLSPNVLNNTLVSNSAPKGGGIYISNSGAATIANNIVAFGSSGICTEGASATLHNNCVYGNTAYDYAGISPDYASVSADPLFADMAGGNLHVQSISPCVDAGTNYYAPSADRDGNTRPIDGNVDGQAVADIGAYEYQPGRSVSKASVALADLNNDGADEAVIGTDDGRLRVITVDGTDCPGWPKTVGGTIAKAPAIGDIDADGAPEIAVTTEDGMLYVFEQNGNPSPGWQNGVEGNCSGPALCDIDNDGRMEIICGYGMAVCAFNHDGTICQGWPRYTNDPVYGTPAVGDIDGDGANEIVASDTTGLAWAWNGDGSTVPGWEWNDVGIGSFATSPVLADLDADLLPEVAVCSDTGQLAVLDGDGSVIPYWSVDLGSPVSTSPAVGDVFADGVLDIVVVCNDGKVKMMSYYGVTQLYDIGSSYSGYEYLSLCPILGDVDSDGGPEIIVGWPNDRVYVVDGQNMLMSDWPKIMDTPVRSSVAIGNMDGDDKWDIVLGTNSGSVYRWETDSDTSVFSHELFPWPTFHGDNKRTGKY